MYIVCILCIILEIEIVNIIIIIFVILTQKCGISKIYIQTQGKNIFFEYLKLIWLIVLKNIENTRILF